MNTTKRHQTAPIHNNLFISHIPLSTRIGNETQTQINTTKESKSNISVNSSIPAFSPRLNHLQTMENPNIHKMTPPLPQHQKNRFFKKDIQPKTEIYTPPTNYNHQENPIKTTTDKKIEIQKSLQSTTNSGNDNIQNQQQQLFQRMEGYDIQDNELDELLELYDNYDYSSDELYESHGRRRRPPTSIPNQINDSLFYESNSSEINFEYDDIEQKKLWNEYEISYSDKKK